MAQATVKGQRFNVRVIQDLATNWALELYPVPPAGAVKTAEPFKNWPVPICMKIQADTREDAILHGLEHLKKLGKVDDFHLEPNERPVPATPKPKAEDAEAEA